MIPSKEYIEAKFNEYNAQYFDGQLPLLPIKLSHARTFLGKVCFTKRRQWLFGPYQYSNFVLRINTRLDLPEALVEDTILHEMIHYYIAYNQWHDTSAHGRLFRREMKRINEKGGRHITISYRLNAEQIAQLRASYQSK